MLAFLVTCAAVVALTLFAVNTKYDATRWHTLLFVGMIVFLVLLFVGLFWINKIWYLVISGVSGVSDVGSSRARCGPVLAATSGSAALAVVPAQHQCCSAALAAVPARLMARGSAAAAAAAPAHYSHRFRLHLCRCSLPPCCSRPTSSTTFKW